MGASDAGCTNRRIDKTEKLSYRLVAFMVERQ